MKHALLWPLLVVLLCGCSLDEYRKRPQPSAQLPEACATDALWARRFGEPEGAAETPQRGTAIAWTDQCAGCGSSGCLLIAGDFEGTLVIDQGVLDNVAEPALAETDVFVAALCADGSGSAPWSRGFGDAPGASGVQTLADLAVDAQGNVVLVGQLLGTLHDEGGQPLVTSALGGSVPSALVIKLSPAGELLWARSYGSDRDAVASALTIDALGRILISGSFRGELALASPDVSIWVGGSAPENRGVTDAFVLALDPSGQPLWSRVFGGSGADSGHGIAVRDSGELLVALGCKQNDGNAPASTCSIEARNHDAVLAKLTSDGQSELWKHTFGDDNEDIGSFVRSSGSGPIVFAGTHTRAIDFGGVGLDADAAAARHVFVASFDDGASAATARWATSLSTTGDDAVNALDLAPDGAAIVAGALGGDSLLEPDPSFCFAYDGGAEAFVARLDAETGSIVWGKTFGTAANEEVFDLAIAPDGTIFTIGTIVLPMDLGSGVITGNPVEVQPDVLVAAFPP